MSIILYSDNSTAFRIWERSMQFSQKFKYYTGPKLRSVLFIFQYFYPTLLYASISTKNQRVKLEEEKICMFSPFPSLEIPS